MSVGRIRYDWHKAEIRAVYDTPLLELIYQAASVHRQFHNPKQIQVCKLISIKTGACPEDCSYCAQSSRYQTEVKPQALLDKQTVVEIAQNAKQKGVSRVCMGAAWREVRDNSQFDRVLEMVKDVTDMGLEVCCTLGMLTSEQAKKLETAGLYAYNHNLDTSSDYYSTIITTRTYGDRLNTIENVRQTNVTVCSGGILGLGESIDDRVAMLQTLATLNPHPESVPINILSQVEGTPLEDQPDVPVWDVVRMIATARIVMPTSDVRLSAGRARLSQVEQAFCFMAGANSIFSSDDNKMLTVTTPCPDYDADQEMLNLLGLEMRPPSQRPQPVVMGNS
ncbi:biotin synthase BioB [Anabaena sp. FACHB-709]|uniref:Biotin synthase n=3 Tax=Nostocaceae TaxID=1162 RepID=BIOB_NOSS1|nr:MULTISPECIES: biotin synthase BioB [Nostocaceae]Q8YVQ3.1 RecName: Full=Biotin synthase [Nostoc sp. PCC 7120 = FACHB-418]BAY67539.1 biotin synthase [Trichormus variabilis NIES-23]HBW28972.1 biotin synthase [Nostoc sp. UBA8866]MBD2174804.1 biotin synthase BioB [Anabaena cylindrica FACHB-318]MBD2266565.1 biotin synthase BioB [Anabaena sp. FACHB-709]MBD2276163.1 biotin synthase BioB [Nostoc sp. PCC 7120 = FACHB-418]